jgi:hypothetical protein
VSQLTDEPTLVAVVVAVVVADLQVAEMVAQELL